MLKYVIMKQVDENDNDYSYTRYKEFDYCKDYLNFLGDEIRDNIKKKVNKKYMVFCSDGRVTVREREYFGGNKENLMDIEMQLNGMGK